MFRQTQIRVIFCNIWYINCLFIKGKVLSSFVKTKLYFHLTNKCNPLIQYCCVFIIVDIVPIYGYSIQIKYFDKKIPRKKIASLFQSVILYAKNQGDVLILLVGKSTGFNPNIMLEVNCVGKFGSIEYLSNLMCIFIRSSNDFLFPRKTL